MLLTGLPMICEDVRDSIETVDAKDPLAFVIHYLMRGLIQAAHSALTHYFPLTLQEHFLQNSSHGTPYQKWRFHEPRVAQVDRARWVGAKRSHLRRTPPALQTCTVDISDRRRLGELQQDGLAELARMESHANGLANWLQRHYRMEDVLSPKVLPLGLDEPGFPRRR